jgi:hypothetical protein
MIVFADEVGGAGWALERETVGIHIQLGKE